MLYLKEMMIAFEKQINKTDKVGIFTYFECHSSLWSFLVTV